MLRNKVKRNGSSCLWGVMTCDRKARDCYFVLNLMLLFYCLKLWTPITLANLFKEQKQEIWILLETPRFKVLQLQHKMGGALQVPTKHCPNLSMKIKPLGHRKALKEKTVDISSAPPTCWYHCRKLSEILVTDPYHTPQELGKWFPNKMLPHSKMKTLIAGICLYFQA